MKKLTKEATVENVLESIKKNTYDRTKHIKDFIAALDMIEGNMFISLDAKWGAGKTFYVRQIEQTLNYLTRKTKNMDIEENIEMAFSQNPLANIKLDYTYLPVYYNAWLYDNHDDPLMSLIMIIVKECGVYCDTKLSPGSLSDKIASLLDFSLMTLNNFQFGGNFQSIKEKFQGRDILSLVKTTEEIREKVKEIFNDIINENTDKLIIFIDELDRCKPSFAIEMLERIKHFFDDDRIIFIASINRSQLVHTISKYYGEKFDSTGYLDKFFDRNVYLPEIDMKFYRVLQFPDTQFFLEHITEELNNYYQLSLRENLRFYQCISNVSKSAYIGDDRSDKIIFSAFVPIIIILNIKDEEIKNKFLCGDDSVLDDLFQNIPSLYQMACKFGKINKGLSKENFVEGYNKIKEFYNYSFGDKKGQLYRGVLNISDNFKEMCIKICNGFGV